MFAPTDEAFANLPEGLVNALKDKGPLTVCAPTDAAFEALPDGTVQDLLQPENLDRLVAIYEVAVKSLLEGYTEALDGAARERLRKVLAGIRKDHRVSQQAWILRYALDDVYRSLRDSE